MHKIVIWFVLLSAPFLARAEIYKWVDDEGNVHYGDEPAGRGAKEVTGELPGLSTYSPPKLPDFEPASQPLDKATYYKAVTLVGPEEGATIRNNQGEVTLFVAADPQYRPADYFKVELDGRLLPERYRSTVIRLSNVDRGEHKVTVLLYDSQGELLMRSEPRTFYLHRAFIRRQAR